jgi:flagella basal body P-ring formation protein FlgA
VFRADEIRWLAAQSGFTVAPDGDVCFAWALAPLNRTDVLRALRKSMNARGGDPAADIEITEIAIDRVPSGQLDFPLDGLGKPATLEEPVPVLWRGQVLYGQNRHFAVWARVRIVAPVRVLVAAEKLEAGRLISAAQLRSETRLRFPELKSKSATVDQVIGTFPVRTLSEGAEIHLENLSRPNDVNRGDLIVIEAQRGSVRLVFSGRAESAGHTGDLIAVRNPDTQRIFQARICARDKAIVESYAIAR